MPTRRMAVPRAIHGLPTHMHHLTPFRSLFRGRTLCALGTVLALSACASVVDAPPLSISQLVTPYQIDIQQGNVVTREQMQALQPGMSRIQVRDVLGSPLLTSVFHASRWDYVFTFQRQGQLKQQRKLTVFFKGELLDRVEGDPLPTEAEFVASLEVRRVSEQPPVLQATEEQLKAFAARNAQTAPSTPPSARPGTSYPPLENPGVTP